MKYQRSQEWHARRARFIGSSDAPAIVGCSDYANAYDVYLSKIGAVEPFEGNAATNLGNHLEGPILDLYEESTGQDVRRDVPIIPGEELHDGPAWAAASLDGLSGNRIVEAKSAGMTSPLFGSPWGDDGSGDVPLAYVVQVHHQALCLGSHADSIADVPALLGGIGFRIYHIEIDERILDELRERLGAFWECVTSRTPPAGPYPNMETISRIRRVEGTVTAIDPILVEQWIEARKRATLARKEADNLKREVAHALGDCEFGDFGHGKKWISYAEQTRKGYSVEEKTFRAMAVRNRP